MRARLAVLLCLAALACRGPRPANAPGTCTHVQAVREQRGIEMCEDVWTCARPPGGRFDRVGLHRLAACEGATGPVVVYLPGMHMNGELPIADPRYDLRLYLAAAGLRTWGFDYRTHAVPAAASAADLQALARWTADVFTGDAAWAIGFARNIDPGPVYVAGFSAGASFAYRVAARPDAALAGLVILDGSAASGQRADTPTPAIDVAGSHLPYAERERLLAAVIANPGGPSPLPGYATAGAALADVLYSAPAFGGRGGLSNARDGVSDVGLVATLLRTYDRWWPSAALAGEAPAPRAPLPVLAFASRNMGAAWVERVRASALAVGRDGAGVRELPGYGHLDVLVGRRAAQEVFEPVRAWIAGRR
jgi:alpha-beta hydrolase superfamily lysophospholipase